MLPSLALRLYVELVEIRLRNVLAFLPDIICVVESFREHVAERRPHRWRPHSWIALLGTDQDCIRGTVPHSTLIGRTFKCPADDPGGLFDVDDGIAQRVARRRKRQRSPVSRC